MTVFARIEATRWWAGEITDTARAFANGDDDRLAAAAFARLCSQHGIEFDWNRDDVTRFVMSWGWPVRVKGVHSTDTMVSLEAFDAETPWVVYVNLAAPDMAVVMGLTYRTERAVAANQLLTFEEWALAFHGPYAMPEAA
jgi:hypothetical protein